VGVDSLRRLGTQRKLMLGRIDETNQSAIMLDMPTEGITSRA